MDRWRRDRTEQTLPFCLCSRCRLVFRVGLEYTGSSKSRPTQPPPSRRPAHSTHDQRSPSPSEGQQTEVAVHLATDTASTAELLSIGSCLARLEAVTSIDDVHFVVVCSFHLTCPRHTWLSAQGRQHRVYNTAADQCAFSRHQRRSQQPITIAVPSDCQATHICKSTISRLLSLGSAPMKQ